MSFREIVPQKARGKLVESIWNDDAWTAEVKFDGERRIAQFCGKLVRFTGTPSRKSGKPVEKTDQLPHLSGAYMVGDGAGDRFTKPPASLAGTVLDGELIAPAKLKADGGQSKLVTAISNSLPEEAVRKQTEVGWLRYVVFDCLYWKGDYVGDRALTERRQYASCAVRTWNNPHVSWAEVSTDKRKLLRNVLAAGGEGVVLKHNDHRYGDDKRWVKVKYEATADVVIMGFKAAKEMSKKTDGEISMTKYAAEGLIGAVLCGQYDGKKLVEVASISGMDDDLRRWLTDNQRKSKGLVVQIKHNGREPTGRFRHPRWDRWRPDKAAAACILDLNES